MPESAFSWEVLNILGYFIEAAHRLLDVMVLFGEGTTPYLNFRSLLLRQYTEGLGEVFHRKFCFVHVTPRLKN